jgi:hypothetical protein
VCVCKNAFIKIAFLSCYLFADAFFEWKKIKCSFLFFMAYAVCVLSAFSRYARMSEEWSDIFKTNFEYEEKEIACM